MPLPGRTNVVIVGAGAAGLAASQRLTEAGCDCLLLEAGDAPGGRARTVHPPCLGGTPFDDGAVWLHRAHDNPLADLARARGERLRPGHAERDRLLFTARGRATPEEIGAYDRAEARWRTRLGRAARRAEAAGTDETLRAASARADDGPWQRSLEAWEGAIIAGADADVLSLRDWHRNMLPEDDLETEDGMGALLLRCLPPPEGRLFTRTPATAIQWSPRGVRVATASGRIDASACIVTVSTGVLAAGGIAFDPPLPRPTRAALAGLPMGLLSKVALPLRDAPAEAVPASLFVERRVGAEEDSSLLLTLRPRDRPYLTAYLGGRLAWSVAGDAARAAALVRRFVVETLGRAVAAAFAEEGHVTGWADDPLFLGAYAYAPPGHAESRRMLGRPLGAAALVLAGEACRVDGLAGTVGGAIRDGWRAADAVLARLSGTVSATTN